MRLCVCPVASTDPRPTVVHSKVTWGHVRQRDTHSRSSCHLRALSIVGETSQQTLLRTGDVNKAHPHTYPAVFFFFIFYFLSFSCLGTVFLSRGDVCPLPGGVRDLGSRSDSPSPSWCKRVNRTCRRNKRERVCPERACWGSPSFFF